MARANATPATVGSTVMMTVNLVKNERVAGDSSKGGVGEEGNGGGY